MDEQFSYKKAGVDIDVADAAKAAMKASLEPADPRVLNRLGAFASLFEASFPGVEQPVLVLKMEEPGSKQKLAAQHGRLASIGYDLIHHLVNDIVVMGATPLAVLDVIICGRIGKAIITGLVDTIARACREQGCTLLGGETSEQPGVVEAGVYVLAASIVGVADKAKILDGSRIAEGDVVVAVASNGLHTNGYSLVRALLAEKPELVKEKVGDESFLDAILRPHRCYYQALKGLFGHPGLHGMAHITGGGIRDNLCRILPEGLDAAIDLGSIRVLPVFGVIREAGRVPDADMLRTFNLGVGMTLVVEQGAIEPVRQHLASKGCEAHPIGEIARGRQQVTFRGSVAWPPARTAK